MCICPSVHLCICVYCMCIYASVYLWTCVSVHPCTVIYAPVYLCICVSVHLSTVIYALVRHCVIAPVCHASLCPWVGAPERRDIGTSRHCSWHTEQADLNLPARVSSVPWSVPAQTGSTPHSCASHCTRGKPSLGEPCIQLSSFNNRLCLTHNESV